MRAVVVVNWWTTLDLLPCATTTLLTHPTCESHDCRFCHKFIENLQWKVCFMYVWSVLRNNLWQLKNSFPQNNSFSCIQHVPPSLVLLSHSIFTPQMPDLVGLAHMESQPPLAILLMTTYMYKPSNWRSKVEVSWILTQDLLNLDRIWWHIIHHVFLRPCLTSSLGSMNLIKIQNRKLTKFWVCPQKLPPKPSQAC